MTQPLVSLENVNVSLDGHPILHAVRWALRPGENWAVVGRNGSGKSTFLKLIRGELWPAPGNGGRRLYAFDGAPQTTAVGIREKIALVSPELQARYLQQEWTLTANEVVHSGFLGGDYVYQRPTTAQQDAAIRVIRQLGIAGLMARDVQTLSTGELRKVLVARALAGSPRVLICDEICDGLDAAARSSLLHSLEQLARHGTQLLYTTHREEELFPGLSHCLRLESGCITQAGPIHPQRSPAAAGNGSLPAPARPRPRGSFPGPDATRHESPRRRQSPHYRQSPRALIAISGADVFLAHQPVLSQIHFEVRAGQHWAIVGPNGSGKSTLLKLIAGDVHAAQGGRIQRFGFTSRRTIWEIKRRIGYVAPELQANYRAAISGGAAVASGWFSGIGEPRALTSTQARQVRRVLAALHLEALAPKSILQMSYGEFRKILIARALVQRPELLLCDEPFDGLDRAGRAEMARTLEAVAQAGTGLVVVTHHAGDLPSCTTHLAELRAGRIRAQGPVDANRRWRDG